MGIKILADSCCDLPGFEKNDWGVSLIPLKITVGDTTYVDDGSIHIPELIDAMQNCPTPPLDGLPVARRLCRRHERAATTSSSSRFHPS